MENAVVNLTEHLVGHAVGRHPSGSWQVQIVAKASYNWAANGSLVAVKAAPFLDQDVYAPDGTSLLRAGQLGPPKSRVDLLLTGELVFSPPIEQADVTLSVGNRLRKVVRVFGDRVWVPSPDGLVVPSRPVPIARVPITWSRSFGGSDAEHPELVHRANPVGSGVAKDPKTLAGRPAPNFESPSAPLAATKGRREVVGFGPVAPHWLPRSTSAGTYDDAWKATQCPLLPVDFDPGFFNLAPADQQLDVYLPGDEVRLTGDGLLASRPFLLPSFSIPMHVVTTHDFFQDFTVADTIDIDLVASTVSIISRCAVPLRPDPLALRRIVAGELTAEQRRRLARGHVPVQPDSPKPAVVGA